jgi:hypothetical protein
MPTKHVAGEIRVETSGEGETLSLADRASRDAASASSSLTEASSSLGELATKIESLASDLGAL